MPDPTTPEPTAPEPGDSDASPPAYSSPVLAALPPEERPEPSPACETCPVSMWFVTKNALKCYCNRMHLIVWDGKEAPVMQCDGRELALIELASRAAGEEAME